MFPNVNRAGQYEYLRILESYYENGEQKKRVVANLGRLDKIRDNLPRLAKRLAELGDEPLLAPDDVEAVDALPWGPVLLARHLYEELRLDQIINEHCSSRRRKLDVAETAFVLLANRLTDPRSEHGLARWLEATYVCDRHGVRWLPAWLPEEKITPNQRVRVEPRQLAMWYRTLDALLAGRKAIETELYLRVRDLFSLNVDLVFYDVTNTHFCRRRPKGALRRHGKPKGGSARNVLVVLGVVMANGWPIAHHVFPGNTTDKKTFRSVVEDVEERFGLRRVLVVGDCGIVSPENLKFLSAPGRQVRYLLGLPGRRSAEASAVFERLDEASWTAVDKGNRVQEVRLDEPHIRHLVVESEERKAYEQQLRQRDMERTAEDLRAIEAAIAAGRLKEREKIGARAARALGRHHGARYYSWDIAADGAFRFYEDPAKLAAETIREGRYLLKTDDPNLTPARSVDIYKQLSDVEWAYRDLKDVIQMRPIHHKTDPRIEAHIFVATLALFVKRTLEHHLKDKKIHLTPTEAFEAMRSMGVSVLDFDGERRLLVSSGGRDARRVVKALGIDPLTPPQPQLALCEDRKQATR
jgi:transposase